MYILKNAFISIKRNKGRNILMGVIILVIAVAVTITLAIHNSAEALITSYENQYEIEASIGMNRSSMINEFDLENHEESKEKMNEIFSNINQVNVEDIEKYGDSDYVQSYYYTMQIGMNASNIEAATSDSENNSVSMGRKNDKMMTSSDFTVIGYSSYEAMNEFISGKYKIQEGQVFEDLTSNDCLINSELATLNNISIGDTITLVHPEDESKTYELIVRGIYQEVEEETENQMTMFTGSVNTIITSTHIVQSIIDANEDLQAMTTPTFILTSKNIIEDFQNELYEKGLSPYLTVTTNLDQVEASTSSISNVSTFAVTFLVITLIIGAVVLFVLNMINIRERKYEIGVLRTIGMKKSKLTLQFMSELIIVATISLLLGAGIGSCVSVPVSNYLLQNEINSNEQTTTNIRNNFGGQIPDKNMKFNGVKTVQAFDSIDAAVDMKVLVELLGIGVLLTLISSSAALISIQKFSPLTILKERT